MGFRVDDLVGTELAGFRLTKFLGEGGMAAVYRGENVLNPAIVRAIKIVRPEHTEKAEFVRRFAEEALILERLTHPNVVRFFGLRQAQAHGSPVLLMELELLDGMTLHEAMLQHDSRAGVSVSWAVSCIARAAEGVAAAHDANIVHRDLKPENIFLTRAGEVKVLDFGIAKLVDDEDRRTKLTQVGMVAGTVAYMAPEVCNGSVPNASADVYALGVSLYELLLGHHPYQPPGAPLRSSPQLMMAHVSQALPKIREARKDVSPKLEQVMLRATAKEPSQRYANARDLAAALRQLATDLPKADAEAPRTKLETEFAVPVLSSQITTDASLRAATPAAPPSRKGLWIGAGAATLLLVGGAAFAFRTPTEANTTTSASDAGAQAAARDASVGIAPLDNPFIQFAGASPREERYYDDYYGTTRTRTVMLRLGIPDGRAPETVSGFRPDRNVVAPSAPFELQQHEVTWSELEPFLANPENSEYRFERSSKVPASASERARLPAVGVPWNTARAYCISLHGTLPSEEQWEYAARGDDLRAYPWGDARIDTARTRVYAGTEGTVAEVMTNDQDVTPTGVYDMLGNAREWTVDIFRADRPNEDESWTQANGVTFRAIRGLPLTESMPYQLPAIGSAVRDALCGTGSCPDGTQQILDTVGFRCARAVRGH